jgi:hypothetical protein
MKYQASFFSLPAVWLLVASAPTVLAAAGDLPPDFAAEAVKHVKALVRLGSRTAGGPNEDQAARYVADRFREMGLRVEIEPFAFESFEVSRVRAKTGDENLRPVEIGMDPYTTELSYAGPCFLLDPRKPSTWPNRELIDGRTIVTAKTADASLHFRLATLGPRFIVYLSPSEFLRLKRHTARDIWLSVDGRLEKGRSLNVIAHLGAPLPAPQILLVAHLDSYRDCRGANDNATGVGALIELARYFKNLGTPLGFGFSFIAFGAEELGILGSRHYVAEHAEDLEHLVLVLALDNLGGPGPAGVERNGGESVVPRPTKRPAVPEAYRGRAWEGTTFPWVLLPRPGGGLMEAASRSYHPPWLVASIDAAANELGDEITFTGVQFGDQISFGMAGIATSAVGAVNDVAHTRGDSVESVHWDTMELCAGIAARVVLNVIDRWTRLRDDFPGASRVPGTEWLRVRSQTTGGSHSTIPCPAPSIPTVRTMHAWALSGCLGVSLSALTKRHPEGPRQ